MIAFHFPPFAASSGIQRTLRFVQQLPAHGWQPVVLTAASSAYDARNDDLLREVPADVQVARCFALDAARHLSLRGRYPALLARPDRWRSWWLGAVPAGLRLIRQRGIDALWSTYPIPTAHAVGTTLHRLTGLPWVADFRDPMAQEGYPADPATWRSFRRIEERVMAAAAACTFTTPGALRLYRERFERVADERLCLVENGYDEETFASMPAARGPLVPGCVTLLHSGIVYPSERDPTQLVEAVAQLRQARPATAARLRLRFRAPVHADLLAALVHRHGVGELVEIAPPIPYRLALQEMVEADGLLLLQAANCADQVPAKYYEYLRARRPIVAFTSADGDTARLMQRDGLAAAAALDDAAGIASALARFVEDAGWRDAQVAADAVVTRASRSARTAQLAALLDRVVAAGGRAGAAAPPAH